MSSPLKTVKRSVCTYISDSSAKIILPPRTTIPASFGVDLSTSKFIPEGT